MIFHQKQQSKRVLPKKCSFFGLIVLTLSMLGASTLSVAENAFAAANHTIYIEFYGINSSYSEPEWSYTESVADGSVYEPQETFDDYSNYNLPSQLVGYYNTCTLMDYGDEDWQWNSGYYGSGITISQDIHLRYECAVWSYGDYSDSVDVTYDYADGSSSEYDWLYLYSGDQIDKTTTRSKNNTEYSCVLSRFHASYSSDSDIWDDEYQYEWEEQETAWLLNYTTGENWNVVYTCSPVVQELDVTLTDQVTFSLLSSDTNDAVVSNIQVTNNSSLPVAVLKIEATAEAGYTLDSFSQLFNTFNADSGHFGIAYTGANQDGQDISGNGLSLNEKINASAVKSLTFKGKSSVYSTAISADQNIHMANIILTIDFYE